MRSLLVAFVLLGIAGCSAPLVTSNSRQLEPIVTPEATVTPGASTPAGSFSFDLALVQSNFTAECQDPIVVDDLFCEQVKISEMTAAGKLLTVPTTLNAAATDRAAAICDQLAIAHFDGDTSADLGYVSIEVLDRDGGTAATCFAR